MFPCLCWWIVLLSGQDQWIRRETLGFQFHRSQAGFITRFGFESGDLHMDAPESYQPKLIGVFFFFFLVTRSSFSILNYNMLCMQEKKNAALMELLKTDRMNQSKRTSLIKWVLPEEKRTCGSVFCLRYIAVLLYGGSEWLSIRWRCPLYAAWFTLSQSYPWLSQCSNTC